MAAANRKTGSATVVKWTPSGGSIVTISDDHTKFNFKRKGDTADVTAGNETARYPIPTIENAEWTITIFEASQSFQPQILPLTTGLLTVYKLGIGTGKPVMSFNCVVTEYSEEMPFDKAMEITISGTRQGAMIQEEGTVQP